MVQDFIGNKLVGGNNQFIMVKKKFALLFKFNRVYVGTKCRVKCWMLVIIEVQL